jgi:hypothetical protein
MSEKPFNRAQIDALATIQNFILYLASDETERDRLYEVALDYVEQDHTLADSTAGIEEQEI